MATEIFSDTSPDAEEENLQKTWVETAITVTATAVAALIVGFIAMVMAMA